MRRIPSTRGTNACLVGLLLLAGLLLAPLPAGAQTITVTSAVPDTTVQGTVDLVVTIGGDGFAKGAKAAFYVTGTTSPGGITVKSTKYKNPKTLEATIDVAPDAQTDLKFDVQVTSGTRTGKGTELFSVSRKFVPPADPHIAFHTVREILVCNEDGQRLTTVYSAGRTGFAGHPSLSPALDAVVFNELNLSQIIRVDFSVVNGDVVTGAPRVLYDGYGAADNCGGPHWSPDGARIVVQCYDGDAHFFIGVMPADGVLPGETPVTAYAFAPGMTMGDHAIWNTAGDGVIFSACVEGVAGSCVLEELGVDANGYPIGEPVVILSDPMFGDEIKNLSAAKTRNSVAFNSLGGGYILDLETGTVSQAFQGSWPVWSPGDTQILVLNYIRRTTQRFQKVTLATGEVSTMDFGGNQPDWR